MEPGLQMTMPRSISSRSTPRSRTPTLSPACASSRILRNISSEVATVFFWVPMPTISISAPGVDLAALDTSGRDRAAAGDREDVLDGHEERLVDVADGLGDARVARLDELEDGLLVRLVALERLEGRAADDRRVVAGELVVGQQLADLELDEVEDLLVVDEVALVQEDDDVRHADLTGEQDVLARLRHRTVVGGDHEDRAVHLGGARDHVLDVVDVARDSRRARSGARPTRTRRA